MEKKETKMKARNITFGAAITMAHRQNQLEWQVQKLQDILTGRNNPMLPEKWTDEDAWALAWDLANLMAQIKRFNETVFDKENPYPDDDTLLEDIPYYNPFFPDANLSEDPIKLWAEALHCGILIAMGNPDFCFPSKGAFGDLEDLFLGFPRGGGRQVQQFDFVLSQIEQTLSERRSQKLQEMNFGPAFPKFEEPQNADDRNRQDGLYTMWQEWKWLQRYPCRSELQKAIQGIRSKEQQVMGFIQTGVWYNDLLRKAISLYLYQRGTMGVMGESYFVTYAMLCQTERHMRAAIAAEENSI